MNRFIRLSLGFLLAAFLLAGCGKEMTDEQFVSVATTMYENVKAGWDTQPDEPWEVYLERRIAEACNQHGVKVKDWDAKMRAVQKEPDAWSEKLDPGMLGELIKWQQERLGGD